MLDLSRLIRRSLALAACCSPLLFIPAHADQPASMSSSDGAQVIPTGLGGAIDTDVERIRRATTPYRDPSKAVAAGYKATEHCVAHPTLGGMGLHYDHLGLRDTILEVEKPEVLVYEKKPDGTLKLNGVEYIVPIESWTSKEPPQIMGQQLKRAERLGIWYLHVWSWDVNPSGLFADWHPRVKCAPSGAQ